MRFQKIMTVAAACGLMLTSLPALAMQAEVGKAAPEIEAVDAAGNAFKLSDHKGKTVVLEWTNHQCPFVMKHYDSGNMQKVQKEAMAMGDVEWVTIVSSAPGKQGNVSAEEALKIVSDAGATISAKILDESGEIGKAYGAQTTPHMFVIDPEGTLVYAGAIDSDSSPNPASIESAENYVLAALASVKAGEDIVTSTSQPYGCAVKY